MQQHPHPIGRLILVLAVFLLLGGPVATYLWHVLNQLLTGDWPGIELWVALGVLVVLGVLLGLLGVWTRRVERREPETETAGDAEGPSGTLFLLTVYVIALAGMWGTIYWLLLGR